MEGENSIDSLTDRELKEQVKDPVCGMRVNPDLAQHKTQYKGENFYFCCDNCLSKFQANPEKTLSFPPQQMGAVLVSLGATANSSKPMILSATRSAEPLPVA